MPASNCPTNTNQNPEFTMSLNDAPTNPKTLPTMIPALVPIVSIT